MVTSDEKTQELIQTIDNLAVAVQSLTKAISSINAILLDPQSPMNYAINDLTKAVGHLKK